MDCPDQKEIAVPRHVVYETSRRATAPEGRLVHSPGRSAVADEAKNLCGRGTSVNGWLVVLGAVSVAVSLFAAQAPGSDHWLFTLFMVMASTMVLAYVTLRCLSVVGPESLCPFCAILVWFLCFLLSFSSSSRRRKLLGLGGTESEEHCEEGNVAMWIALLLLMTALFVPMQTVVSAVFGQLISVQYLIIGVAFPRSVCEYEPDSSYVGGALFGMPPLWASALQLSLLAALFVQIRCRCSAEEHAARCASKFAEAHVKYPNEKSLGYWLASVIEDLEVEESNCRQLLADVSLVLPSDCSCVIALDALADFLGNCRIHLRSQHQFLTEDEKLQKVLDAVSDAGPTSPDTVGWLAQSWTSTRPEYEHGFTWGSETSAPDSEDRDHAELIRHPSQLITTMGLREELNIGEWDFDPLAVDREKGHVLQLLGFELLRHFDFLPRVPLASFLAKLEASYHMDNAYHSHVHGADMTNNFVLLAQKCKIWDKLPCSSRAAAVIAGLGHDVGHFKRSNMFLIATRHAFAITYNDRSVMENFHAATLVGLLDELYPNSVDSTTYVTVLQNLPKDQAEKGRHLLIDLILRTDTQKHLEDLGAFRMRLSAESFDPVENTSDHQQSLAVLFRAADIGHSAKCWRLHVEWSQKVVQEFHEQGDEEKKLGLKVSPLCEREGDELCKGQVGFLSFICLPTWREVARLEEFVAGLLQAVDQSDQNASHHGEVELPRKSPSSRRWSHVASVAWDAIKTTDKNELETEEWDTVEMKRQSPPLTVRGMQVPPRRMSMQELGGRSSPSTPTMPKLQRISSRLRTSQSSLSRVAPLTPTGVQTFDHITKDWITNVVLAQCEQNFQTWKTQVEACAASAQETTATKTGAPPEAKGRHELCPPPPGGCRLAPSPTLTSPSRRSPSPCPS